MATTIDVGGTRFGRTDLFAIDPFQLQIREELRGRRFAPTAEQITEMALTLMKDGQIEPVEVRKIGTTNRLEVTLGFTRTSAARLIRTGFEDADGNHYQDEEFLLKVLINNGVNDRKAFERNIIENLHRNELSDVDHAHNQQRMRDQWMMSDEEIATFYRCSVSKVQRLQKILGLAEMAQEAIHNGLITTAAALEVRALPEAEQATLLQTVTENGGKVTAGAVREQVREHILRDDPSALPPSTGTQTPPPAPKVKARTTKELREWLRTEPRTNTQESFAAVFIAYLDGTATDAQLRDAMDTYIPSA